MRGQQICPLPIHFNMRPVSSDVSIQRDHWPLSVHLWPYCTHPMHDVNDVWRLTTTPGSTSPALFEQWCGFFYVPQEPKTISRIWVPQGGVGWEDSRHYFFQGHVSLHLNSIYSRTHSIRSPMRPKKFGCINGVTALPGQGQISWLNKGCNEKYTIHHICTSWTIVLSSKQPECRYCIKLL